MVPEIDVAVIGAGPSGVAAALGLLAQGLSVAVIDPCLPPGPRIESLPSNGIVLAKALGLGPALDRAGMGRAARMRLLWREVPETRDFGADGPLLLDKVLLHRALRDLLPQDCIRHGRVGRVEGDGDRVVLGLGQDVLSARFVIDARGRAGLRAAAVKAKSQVALSFAGRSVHAAARPEMLLHALPDGWLWACQLSDGHLSGALFLAGSSLAGLDARGRAAALARHLSNAQLDLPTNLVAGTVSSASLQFADSPFASPRVLRVGDATLARDPIASHGLVHALRSGAQAAAVAATFLDPTGQADAARAFALDRHRDAFGAARKATMHAHSDQSRQHSGFWTAREPAEQPELEPVVWPVLTHALSLTPLRRAAVLDHGRIRWSQAVWLARSGQAASRFGPVAAERLVTLLGPPAPIVTLSARLETALGPTLAQAILRQLLDEGALRDAAAPQPDQDRPAALSNA